MNCIDRNTSKNPCSFYLPFPAGGPGYCSLPQNYHCLVATEKVPFILSYSSMSSFQKCKYQWYLSHIHGIQLKDEYKPVSMRFGQAIDFILNNFYSGQEILSKLPSFLSSLFSEEEIYTQAKVTAIAKAKINILSDNEEICELHNNPCQQSFNLGLAPANNIWITGVIDRLYDTYFVETKTSSRPEIYENLNVINDQVGTYFLATKVDKAVIETIRVPGLQYKDNEDPGKYEERVLKDIFHRPKYYFKRKSFYRSEFDLEELSEKYSMIAWEIMDASKREAFYRNYASCGLPYPCMYKPICNTGRINEKQYKVREKKNG